MPIVGTTEDENRLSLRTRLVGGSNLGRGEEDKEIASLSARNDTSDRRRGGYRG